MPVVMTGSPGGPLGGNNGSAFGSGLGGLSTSPSKLFTPNLEVWTRRAEEDRLMHEERRQEYDSMMSMRLGTIADKKQQAAFKKQKEQDAFQARQQARLEEEAAEKEKLKKWRLESIEKNKVDHHMDMREGEPGYGPTRWCWPTAHHHPRQCASGVDVGIDFVYGGPGALVASAASQGASGSPTQAGESQLLALAAKLPNHLDEMKKSEFAMRQKMAEEDAEAAALAKREREDAARARQAEFTQRAEAKKAAAIRAAAQIKRQMAAETRRAAKEAADCEQKRYAKSQAERAQNVLKLSQDTHLRDDAEIANERREGSPMSKGGKEEFLQQLKAGTYDE